MITERTMNYFNVNNMTGNKIKIKSITIEASKKVNTTDDKIKALENKLETQG
jgi:hypothetical protein